MSSKVNILDIVRGHFKTFESASNGKKNVVDYFTFIFVPLLLSFLFFYFEFSLSNDLMSLLVNFGAIFTALLLSVLVLVYDQGEKLKKLDGDEKFQAVKQLKKKLLEQLYFNICYAVVVSVCLVFLCLVYSVFGDYSYNLLIAKINIDYDISVGKDVFAPFIVFLLLNLLLTILMVVKRMHTLLTLG